MAAPTKNEGLDTVSSNLGTLTKGTKFAVQGESTTGILQVTTFENMSESGAMTNTVDDAKIVTPKAFFNTKATETKYGVVELADGIDIGLQQDDKVLTSARIPDIMLSAIKPDLSVQQSGVDAATQGTVTIVDVRGSTYGQMSFLGGTFNYASNGNADTKEIYINDCRQPLMAVEGYAAYVRNDEPTTRRKFSIKISSSGVNTNGIGQIKLSINTAQAGLNWETGKTYVIDFGITFISKY